MRKSLIVFVTFLAVSFYFVQAWALTEVRLALHWLPQSQFAGYYIALEKGFYRDSGLNVTIFPGGPDTVPADRLSSGEVQFASMFLSSAIERRIAGISLVNIAQIVQRSALLIITKKESGIQSIKDLAERQVTMWGNEFQLQPWALFKEHNINVSVVPSSGSMELFLRDAVPATLAMWYNGYHTVLSSGYKEKELQTFFFKDTNFDFPEDGIYCLSSTIQNHPEMVTAFVEATMKGWEYSWAHEDESLEIVAATMEKAKAPYSRVHQRWMMKKMKDIMHPKELEGRIGALSKSSFDTVVSTLQEAGLHDSEISFDDFVWGQAHVQ